MNFREREHHIVWKQESDRRHNITCFDSHDRAVAFAPSVGGEVSQVLTGRCEVCRCSVPYRYVKTAETINLRALINRDRAA